MNPIRTSELELLREYVLLPYLLTVLERDKRAVEQSQLKYQNVYIEIIESAMNKATKEITRLKQVLGKMGIKVNLETRREFDVCIEYSCRGYVDTFVMQWVYLSAEVQIRVKKYLSNPPE